VMT
jgi:hypothetical protein